MNQAADITISAILPLKLHGGKNAENLARCHILLSSLATFAEPRLFNEIVVVVPSRDRRAAEHLCSEWKSLAIVVIDEEEYLPVLHDRRHMPGQSFQMAIKLHAANYLRASFFITLDADVILCKHLRRSDLFVGMRALLEPCPREIHPFWWRGSARLLGLTPDPSAPGMSVTPAILARPICLRIFEDLERGHGRDWAATLLRLRSLVWTEYALYYLTAEKHGMLGDFHVVAGVETRGRICCPSAVWYRSQFEHWNVEECFDPDVPGFFTVVQSNSGISPEAIRRRIAPYLAV